MIKTSYQQRSLARPSMLDAVLKKQAQVKKESLVTKPQDTITPPLFSPAQLQEPAVISKQELIEQLRQEIKELIEKIMRPDTPDEIRFELGAIYEQKNKTFNQLGGKFDEVLTSEGWRKH